jgi:Arc/MetJ family transcription regulator
MMCDEIHRMATNLDLDDRLLNLALRVGGRRTKKETVHEALEEYVSRRKRLEAVKAFGTFSFDPKYDYRRERRRR